MSFNTKTEEYYKKFIELQEKLRKSEEERLKLEMKFNEMVQVTREEEQIHYHKLRSQYKRFLEEDRRRQDRNERILRTLERIESRVAMLMAKTERFKLLRQQYQTFLDRIYRGNQIKKAEPPSIPKETQYEKPKSVEDKSDIVQTYLQNLSSQKLRDLLKNEEEARERLPFSVKTDIREEKYANYDDRYSFGEAISRPNYANSIADDIMNSIYSRHNKSSDDLKRSRTKELDNNRNIKQFRQGNDYEMQQSNTADFRNYPKEFKKALNQNYVAPKQTDDSDMDDLSEPEIYHGENHVANNKSEDKISSVTEKRETDPYYQKMDDISNNIEKTDDDSSSQKLTKDVNINQISHSNERRPLTQVAAQPITLQNKTENENIGRNINILDANIDNNKSTKVRFEGEGDMADNNASKVNQPLSETREQKQNEIEPITSPQKDEQITPKQHFETIEPIMKLKEEPKIQEKPSDENNQQESEQKVYATDQSLNDLQLVKSDAIDTSAKKDESEKQIIENKPEPSVVQLSECSENFQSTSKENIEQPHEEYNENEQLQQLKEDEQPAAAQQNYEESGKLLQIHNDSDQPLQQQDENGQSVLYDQYNQPQYDDGSQFIQQYDENGQPIQMQDYSEHGQFVQQYDENGQPVQLYDESGQPIQHYNESQPIAQYDENGQLIQQYNNADGQFIQQYDASGQPILQYDENGQLIQPYHEGGEMFQQYDEHGQLIQQYGEDGQLIQQYNENGQPLQQYDGSEQLMQQYDENGQLLQQYDENGQPLQQYNENGEIIHQYDPYGQVQLQYDENGQIIQQYDENEVPERQPSGDQQFYDQPHGEIAEREPNQAEDKQEASEQQETGELEKDKNQAAPVESKKTSNVMDILDTDTESAKQDTKVSNDSDFDFSNG